MSEWKNWKTVKSPNIRYDPHHAEVVDIYTGEVLNENMSVSKWEDIVKYESNLCNRKRNYYRQLRIFRMDIGDAFCNDDFTRY